MRVIIAGSREFSDYRYLAAMCNRLYYFAEPGSWIVLSGGARGADQLGERWARDRDFKLKVYPADWDKHGRGAGFIRNVEMAKNADMLIAFWDAESPGTRHMIHQAQARKLDVHVFQGWARG